MDSNGDSSTYNDPDDVIPTVIQQEYPDVVIPTAMQVWFSGDLNSFN